MKSYIVKKDKHYCFHGQSMHFDKENLIINFSIPEESRYSLAPPDDEDINKIGGVVFGLEKLEVNKHGVIGIAAIHENSIRLGMYDKNGMIMIYVYWYNKGVRNMRYIATSLYGIYNSFNFKFDRINNQFKINNRMGTESFFVYYDFSKVSTWGFYAYPYFGGNNPAQSDWKVDLKLI